MNIMSLIFNATMPHINEHVPHFDVVYHIKNASNYSTYSVGHFMIYEKKANVNGLSGKRLYAKNQI